VEPFLRGLPARHLGQTVALVTHELVCQILVCLALVTLLNDEHGDFYMQREALLALARIGSPEALQALRAARGHPSRLVRDLARRLFAGSEGPR